MRCYSEWRTIPDKQRKIYLARLGFESATFGLLVRCSTNWATGQVGSWSSNRTSKPNKKKWTAWTHLELHLIIILHPSSLSHNNHLNLWSLYFSYSKLLFLLSRAYCKPKWNSDYNIFRYVNINLVGNNFLPVTLPRQFNVYVAIFLGNQPGLVI